MKTKSIEKWVMLASAVLIVLSLAGCKKKEYPNKKINLIIQAAPGGESDSTGRLIAQQMEKELGVPVVCANKTGASGSVAFQYVISQPSDGYTIGICPAEICMVEPLGISKVTPADMDLLGGACETPSAVIVRTDAPYKTLQEFVQYCKDNPNKVRNGTSGAGSTLHVGGELFAQAAGIKFQYVPFDGSGPAVTALMGGHVEVVTIGVLSAAAGLDTGDLRILAILGDERSARVPDIPTAKEAGINCTYTTWVGLYGPKGLPADVKAKLESAIQAGVEGQGYTEFTTARGLQKKYRNASEFTQFVNENYAIVHPLDKALEGQ